MAVPLGINNFAQKVCAAVPKLRGEAAELVPCIGLSQWLGPVRYQVAGKYLRLFIGCAGRQA